ncbi:MAG: PEP-CTERM sorting domain-containing protein [Burkholderiales bacterium]
MRSARFVAGSTAALCVLFSVAADAIETKLYDFRIARVGGPEIFIDTFDDGMPPPSAPDFVFTGPASYTVLGNYSGSETPSSPPSVPDGFLRLDAANGPVLFNPTTGLNTAVQRARLNTNTGPPDNGFGLKRFNTFVVTGRFDLIDPGGDDVNRGYGIALTDRVFGVTDNFVSFNVGGGPAGPVLRLSYVDNGNVLGNGAMVYVLDSEMLSVGGQIELQLRKVIADQLNDDNDLVTAFYRLNGVGDFIPLIDVNLAADARIFSQVGWTQAEFRFFAAVPEPSTGALLIAALGFLAIAPRRRPGSGLR